MKVKQERREQEYEQENTHIGGKAGLFADDGLGKDGGKKPKQEIVIPEKLIGITGF